MIVFVDFDGTLHEAHHSEFDLWTEPNGRVANMIREMYEEGNEIVIYSCRSNLEICDFKDEDLMIKWLKKNEIPYSRIERDKPYFDILIDDRAANPKDI